MTILSLIKAEYLVACCGITSLAARCSVRAAPANCPGAELVREMCFLGERSHLGLLFLGIESSSHHLVPHSQD